MPRGHLPVVTLRSPDSTRTALLTALLMLSCSGNAPEPSDASAGAGGGSSGSTSGGSGAKATGGASSSTGGGSTSTGGTANAGAGGSGGGATSDPYAQARQDCVDRINAFRATENKPPYERWTSAEACTDGQAQSDSMTGNAHGAFGDCNERAQNECPGWRSVNQIIQGCLQDMWDEGPGEPFSEHGHYINMSNTNYTMVACGFFETSGGQVWAIQNFR
jgi:hypothetical protein